MSDYQYQRAACQCAICGRAKEPDLVACWQCYRTFLRDGESEEATAKLDAAERKAIVFSYRAACLYLDTALHYEAISQDEYIATTCGLLRWYAASMADPQNARWLDAAPLLKAIGIDDPSNVVPFPTRRAALAVPIN
jgi:hypothetical protein